ncbi:hypothetical protein QVD17_35519 [Tagetes erecta]|uniref:Transmembrane protein n=1 Tax=Tagetes erecta TaxID=13708 RepID=A0AAD8JZM2_TARER|nr:hypothetical protein QVD17_35519 [Tagetes erecta]
MMCQSRRVATLVKGYVFTNEVVYVSLQFFRHIHVFRTFKSSFLSPTSIFYDFFLSPTDEDHHFGIFTPPATRDHHHTSRSTFRASIFYDHTHILLSPAAALFSGLLFRLSFCCKVCFSTLIVFSSFGSVFPFNFIVVRNQTPSKTIEDLCYIPSPITDSRQISDGLLKE